jgi:hypothetical protein
MLRPGRLYQFMLCRRGALWVSHLWRIDITASVILEFCLLVHVPQQAILIDYQIACSIIHKLPKMKFGRIEVVCHLELPRLSELSGSPRCTEDPLTTTEMASNISSYRYHVDRVPPHIGTKSRQAAGRTTMNCHASLSTGPHLPVKVGFSDATCSMELDPASLIGRTSMLPHAP